MSQRIFMILAASTVIAAAIFSSLADWRSSQNRSLAAEDAAGPLKPPKIQFLGISRVPAGEYHLRLLFQASNPNDAPLPYRGYLAVGFSPPLKDGVIAPHYLIEFRRDGKWKAEPIGWCGTGAGPVQLPPRGTAQFHVDVLKDNWDAVRVGVDWFATMDRKGATITTWSDAVTPKDSAKPADDKNVSDAKASNTEKDKRGTEKTELQALLNFFKSKGVDLRSAPEEQVEGRYVRHWFSIGPDHKRKHFVGFNYLPPRTLEQIEEEYSNYSVPYEFHGKWAMFCVGGPNGNAATEYKADWEKVLAVFKANPDAAKAPRK